MYGGQSAQERSDARRRQFLDAGLQVLGTRGWSNATVRGVCDEAGLSTRFFYEGFDSLENLALALYEEIVDDIFATVVTALTEARPSPEEQARIGVTALVGTLTDDPRRARIALVHVFDNPAIAERRAQFMRDLAEVIATFGRVGYQLPEGDEPLVAITATIIAGGVAELMLVWVNGEIGVTREQLIRSCTQLVIGIGNTADAMRV